MSQLLAHAGNYKFQTRFEEQRAPKTCAAFRKAMPFESQAIHVRWSGEGAWMPLGDLDFGVSYENHTSYPTPGRIVGRPGRAAALMRFLDYIAAHERVWVPTRLQIAEHGHADLAHLAANVPGVG